MTDQELQSLRNLGNEAEAAATEIEVLRNDLTTMAQAMRAERKLSRDRLKELRRLSDAVLLALHHLDKQIGPDKTIPHAASVRLGQIVGALDLVNDTVRFGALGVDFRKDDKAAAVKKLT